MNAGVLLIRKNTAEDKQGFFGHVLAGKETFLLVKYEFHDDSLHQKACMYENDGNVVTKLVVDGVEVPTKQMLSSSERAKGSGGQEMDCLEPNVRKREAYAYWHACKRVSEGVEKYSEQVSTIPMLIKHNGLGAALMYMRTQKTRVALVKIYEDISDWIRHDEKQLIDLGNSEELAEKIIEVGQEQYKDVTQEVLAYLAFLKPFAKGLGS